MANRHPNSKWKEFAPLFSQQCRLRHLVRITAFNVDFIEDGKMKEARRVNPTPSPVHSANHGDSSVSEICFYYYTLHLTTMSAPFYKSEKIQGENPRWAELEMQEILDHSTSLVSKGVVVRIWKHRLKETASAGDTLVTAWGVHFSGLVPIPMAHSIASPSPLGPNTIVFHMFGGSCFTSSHCLTSHAYTSEGKGQGMEKEPKSGNMEGGNQPSLDPGKEEASPFKAKKVKMCLAESEVRPSYTLPLLLRLRSVEQAIRKQAASAGALRERISANSMVPSPFEVTVGSTVQYNPKDDGSKHLSPRPGNQMRSFTSTARAAKRQALARALVAAESLRLCVSLLKGERGRKLNEVRQLTSKGQELANQNKERGRELKEQLESLLREVEHLREWRHREFLEARETFLRTSAHLALRRRNLVSDLSLIYPILQHPNGGFTICGVKLPNSEDFGPRDEVMVSVALGYVAHAIQMISVFLHVPLRYPVAHLGSRSRISDLITDKIPDGEREFPLFSRAKDKLQFKYGVYLLNKNVAQLRWYLGLSTQDLRATLPNLASLFYPKAGLTSLIEGGGGGNLLNANGPPGNADRSPVSVPLPCHRRSHSGSSHNLQPQVGRVRLTASESSGGGEVQHPRPTFERCHRVTRSAGGKGELLPPSSADINGMECRNGGKAAPEKNQNELKRKDDEVDGVLCNSMGSSLSYSLDKGLDEYEVIQRTGQRREAMGREGMGHSDAEGPLTRVGSALAVDLNKVLSHVGSDPILRDSTAKGVSIRLDSTAEPRDVKVATEAQRNFLHRWHLSGGPVQSDDDAESSVLSEESGQPLNITSRLLCPRNPREGSSSKVNDSTEMRESLSSLLPSGKAVPPVTLHVVTSTSAEVDRLFASVASRTEALASRSTSFNLMRSRQGSTTEDGCPS
ncbi:UV radiation resistance-associated gene protein [Hetaerina americana]|uniref:UV radiation resistance-associated gene protein n=1 Tax=Hetaerina americana TaxID=62018 RepID=UPI003A7F6287